MLGFGGWQINAATLGVAHGQSHPRLSLVLAGALSLHRRVDLLFYLALAALAAASHLANVSTWVALVFVLVYVGGVLVLVIYRTLSSTNAALRPRWVCLSAIAVERAVLGERAHLFSRGEDFGRAPGACVLLFRLLLLCLFLVLAIIKK